MALACCRPCTRWCEDSVPCLGCAECTHDRQELDLNARIDGGWTSARSLEGARILL